MINFHKSAHLHKYRPTHLQKNNNNDDDDDDNNNSKQTNQQQQKQALSLFAIVKVFETVILMNDY